MLTEPTVHKLREMKLGAMADAWLEQHTDPKLGELTFDERFGLLVEAEHMARTNRKLSNLLRKAQLRWSAACVEDIECSPARGIDKATVRQLGTCGWVAEHHNIIITGATGVGKSYVACAFAQQACRRGFGTLYRRVPRLFDEIALARAEGTWPRLLRQYARTDVLVLDDWGLVSLNAQKRQDLLEILEDREGARSTIVTSQLDPPHWHEHIGDPTIADAILDRVVHRAYKMKLLGPSKRRTEEETPNSKPAEASN